MEIKRLNFEKIPVQIRETYIDENGMIRERTRTVMMPTGNLIPDDGNVPAQSEEKEN